MNNNKPIKFDLLAIIICLLISTPGPTSVARPCYDLTPITHFNIFAN